MAASSKMTAKEKRLSATLKAMTEHTKKKWTTTRQYKKEKVGYMETRGSMKP